MIDKKQVEILTNIGLPQAQAKILLYLNKAGTASSRELEFGIFIRQPEVSIGTKELTQKGYLTMSNVKTGGKGRPNKIYKLKKPFKTIIENLTKEYKKQLQEKQEKINQVANTFLNE